MDFESGQEICLDPELEDVRAVIHSICEIVHDHNVASFSVSCGDEEAWPVDVLFDLPILLEQLPENLELLRNTADTIVFDFYEQGIERRMQFARQTNGYAITVHYSDGAVISETELISREKLLEMLGAVRTTFLRLSELAGLSIDARHELLDFFGE